MRAAVLVTLALGLLSGLPACSPCTPITVGPRDGTPVLDLCVDLAVTAVERRTGLRGAAAPPAEGSGLLLQFPGEGTVCLDNEAVAFDLDLIYTDDDEEIVMLRRLRAGDADPICDVNIRRVLEVAVGGADDVRLGHVMTIPRRLE